MNLEFEASYKNKRVFITGHTGFKGSWLALWLTTLGAEVYGYALAPPTTPALFNLLNLKNKLRHQEADIRDREQLTKAISTFKPDIIFHLAAQAVVRESYIIPVETIDVNVSGTMNVMEAVRQAGIETAMIMITSDKCYENKEWLYGYRENDPLGGYDPYSASKAAAEILIASWRNSFFNVHEIEMHGVRIASARAGNVIGGGDWTKDHILTDCILALQKDQSIQVRNPHATRPWQHVLDPLAGYLTLGAKLLQSNDVARYCGAFNFGPVPGSNKSVQQLVDKIIACWGEGAWQSLSPVNNYHEASLLNLSIDKSTSILGWNPVWNFEAAVTRTIEWYRVLNRDPLFINEFTLSQIRAYEIEKSALIKPVEHLEINEKLL